MYFPSILGASTSTISKVTAILVGCGAVGNSLILIGGADDKERRKEAAVSCFNGGGFWFWFKMVVD